MCKCFRPILVLPVSLQLTLESEKGNWFTELRVRSAPSTPPQSVSNINAAAAASVAVTAVVVVVVVRRSDRPSTATAARE